MDLSEVGQLVRRARKKAGLSQAQLQDLSGVNRVRISLLESGEIEELGFTKVMSLLRALGLDFVARPAGQPPQLDDLVRGDDFPEPDGS